ncbi:MAG: LEA type 2 family protein [Myxococcales bacterium]|nr:LEA type 2 family protein [Myxococcales bacterium]
MQLDARRIRQLMPLAFLAIGACSKPEPPTITPYAARVTAVTPLAIGLDLELDVENPNGFALMVQEVSGTMKLGDGVNVGTGRSEPKGSVPAHGKARVSAQLSVPWTNVAALAPFAASQKPVPYSFVGVAKVGSTKLNLDVPFVVRGEITRDQALKAGLRGLGGLIPGLP